MASFERLKLSIYTFRARFQAVPPKTFTLLADVDARRDLSHEAQRAVTPRHCLLFNIPFPVKNCTPPLFLVNFYLFSCDFCDFPIEAHRD